MVNYTDIEAKLQRLDTEYNNSILDPDLPIFYSKLVILNSRDGWKILWILLSMTILIII